MNTQTDSQKFWAQFFVAGTFLIAIVAAILVSSHSTNAHLIAFTAQLTAQSSATNARIDTLIHDGNVERKDILARIEANRLGIEANSQEIKQLRQDLMRHGNRLIRIEELLQKNN